MARHALITTQDNAQLPGVTITGGTWKTNLPSTNMLSIQPQLVAQVDGTSVSFTIDLNAARFIGLIHFQRLITANNGTIRVRAGTYDSGTVNSWPTDGAGVYSSLLYAALGRPRFFIPPAPVFVSSILVDINAVSGYLQIGYAGVCEVLEMPDNMLIGNILTINDESDIQTIPHGSTYVTLRGKRRVLDFGLPPLREDNGDFYDFFDTAVVNGMSSPVAVCKFPDDTYNLERTSIWGFMSKAPQFTNTFYAHSPATFTITQAI